MVKKDDYEFVDLGNIFFRIILFLVLLLLVGHIFVIKSHNTFLKEINEQVSVSINEVKDNNKTTYLHHIKLKKSLLENYNWYYSEVGKGLIYLTNPDGKVIYPSNNLINEVPSNSINLKDGLELKLSKKHLDLETYLLNSYSIAIADKYKYLSMNNSMDNFYEKKYLKDLNNLSK